jgi:hypothetical protein
MGAPAVAAVILRKERELIDLFRDAGATTPATAKSLDDVGVMQAWPLSRLRRRAVVREAAPGKYYVDEEVWQAMRGLRQRLVLAVLAIFAVVSFAVWIGFVSLH